MKVFVTALVLLSGSASISSAFAPPLASPSHCQSASKTFIEGRNVGIVHHQASADHMVLHLSSRAEDANGYLPARSVNPLERISEGYKKLTTEHYLTMAFLQAGCLASIADATTQVMEGAGPVDVSHVAAMATVASTMSGAMNAVWLRQLEETFPGTGTKEVAAKTLIHAVILASIINSAYLAGVPLFDTYYTAVQHGAFHSLPPLDISTFFAGWSMDEFLTLTKLEVMMFIPYNTLAFKFVPPAVRPLTHATISATFNVAVSAITLGYFNTWCDRAFSVFHH